VLAHPNLLHSGSSSLGAGFTQTKGFIFRFSKSGVPQLRSHPHAACLLPFFDAARAPTSNAFVLNVLCCTPTPDKGHAVGWHKDATLALREGADVAGIPFRLASSVSVLYLSLPPDIVGGELELKHPEEQPEAGSPSRVQPKENRLAVFRGDAEHAVRNFDGSSNRVSLVLEQYDVPIGEVGWLKTFECVGQDEYMKLRL
jgi:hypothetical protein